MKNRTDRRRIGSMFGRASGRPLHQLSLGTLIASFSCALLLTSMAGLAVAKDKDVPVPKKGIEKALGKTQNPSTPQAQCSPGMVWSAKDGQCISELKTGAEPGGGAAAGKTPHSEFESR